jgi:transcription antitermination protein NusB
VISSAAAALHPRTHNISFELESFEHIMQSDGEGSVEERVTSKAGRATARLAAVQALYQMDLTQRDLSDVLEQFLVHRFESGDVKVYEGADRGFFRDVVSGAVHRQAEIDSEIAAHLAGGWRLSRIDSILRAILRSGVYEIIGRPDVPVRAIINEYVEIAHDFFGGEEPAVVNGVLDRVARSKRQNEFGRKTAKRAG